MKPARRQPKALTVSGWKAKAGDMREVKVRMYHMGCPPAGRALG